MASLGLWKSGGGPAVSLSKTWNVAKLTSEISSSPRKISCSCEDGDVFADTSLIEAQAPLAIEREMPANPKAGKALLRRLPIEERFGMTQFSHLLEHGADPVEMGLVASLPSSLLGRAEEVIE